MKIDLTADQEAWLATRVAEGEFASIEAAVTHIIDARIVEDAYRDDDLAWAKPLVGEALAQVERGETIPLEDWKAHSRAWSAPSDD